MPEAARHYDVIVLGSGTSGGVAGQILAEAGAKVLMLEAGKHYTAQDFPMAEAEYSPRLYWGGGLEYNTRVKLAFLRGRCVGGGSVVNGALMDRFDEVALDDFRAESGCDFFTKEAMAPHYDYAESAISIVTIPEAHRNNNTRTFIEGADRCGYAWKPMKRCQTDCATERGNDCMACLGGCHRDSKQSTLATYVPRALAAGMELASECFVHRIEHAPDGVTVYARQQGQERIWQAGKVILALGAFGTSQLLLNSGFKDRLPAVGTRVSMHPQYMSFAEFDHEVDAHKGVLQGAGSDDARFRPRGFKLESVFAPPISVGVLSEKTGRPLQEFLRNYRHFACMEVAVRDEAVGELQTNRTGRLRILKDLTDQDRARARDGLGVIREILGSLNPRQFHEFDWAFGLHLMGGCCMGQDARTNVVAPDFTVHDHPNLLCADSSVFPNAPGINPALTIMALSHRMASALAGEQPVPWQAQASPPASIPAT